MVEEIVTPISPIQKSKTLRTARPKPVYLWTVADVQKWFKRHCGDYIIYADAFLQHEITGRAMLRITDNSLYRMGIENNCDREAIWREIVKQRLKTDIMEVRDLEFMNIYYEHVPGIIPVVAEEEQ